MDPEKRGEQDYTRLCTSTILRFAKEVVSGKPRSECALSVASASEWLASRGGGGRGVLRKVVKIIKRGLAEDGAGVSSSSPEASRLYSIYFRWQHIRTIASRAFVLLDRFSVCGGRSSADRTYRSEIVRHVSRRLQRMLLPHARAMMQDVLADLRKERDTARPQRGARGKVPGSPVPTVLEKIQALEGMGMEGEACSSILEDTIDYYRALFSERPQCSPSDHVRFLESCIREERSKPHLGAYIHRIEAGIVNIGILPPYFTKDGLWNMVQQRDRKAIGMLYDFYAVKPVTEVLSGYMETAARRAFGGGTLKEIIDAEEMFEDAGVHAKERLSDIVDGEVKRIFRERGKRISEETLDFLREMMAESSGKAFIDYKKRTIYILGHSLSVIGEDAQFESSLVFAVSNLLLAGRSLVPIARTLDLISGHLLPRTRRKLDGMLKDCREAKTQSEENLRPMHIQRAKASRGGQGSEGSACKTRTSLLLMNTSRWPAEAQVTVALNVPSEVRSIKRNIEERHRDQKMKISWVDCLSRVEAELYGRDVEMTLLQYLLLQNVLRKGTACLEDILDPGEVEELHEEKSRKKRDAPPFQEKPETAQNLLLGGIVSLHIKPLLDAGVVEKSDRGFSLGTGSALPASLVPEQMMYVQKEGHKHGRTSAAFFIDSFVCRLLKQKKQMERADIYMALSSERGGSITAEMVDGRLEGLVNKGYLEEKRGKLLYIP